MVKPYLHLWYTEVSKLVIKPTMEVVKCRLYGGKELKEVWPWNYTYEVCFWQFGQDVGILLGIILLSFWLFSQKGVYTGTAAALMSFYGSFQLSSSLKSPPYLCECAGRNSKYGCAVLEKLCEAGTVTGTGDGLVVASPTNAVWLPKQVKYIHSGLCFLEGTNREVYLTFCFTVLMFLSRVRVTCFVHRIV